jgi:hypothetical protein
MLARSFGGAEALGIDACRDADEPRESAGGPFSRLVPLAAVRVGRGSRADIVDALAKKMYRD